MLNIFKKFILILISFVLLLIIFNSKEYIKHDYNKTLKLTIYYPNTAKKVVNVVQGTKISDIKAKYIEKIDENLLNYGDDEPIYDGEIIDLNKSRDNLLISINTNEIKKLILLPGIGEKTALKIIDYRKKYGDFKYIEEIKNVNGIGDKKYETIKELISI